MLWQSCILCAIFVLLKSNLREWVFDCNSKERAVFMLQDDNSTRAHVELRAGKFTTIPNWSRKALRFYISKV